jgi:hypothetical protein
VLIKHCIYRMLFSSTTDEEILPEGVRCHAPPCTAMPCHAMRCNAMPCGEGVSPPLPAMIGDVVPLRFQLESTQGAHLSSPARSSPPSNPSQDNPKHSSLYRPRSANSDILLSPSAMSLFAPPSQTVHCEPLSASADPAIPEQR